MTFEVRAREADAGAGFEAFFDETYEPMLRALYLLTGDRLEAEDLAQEAFVRAYERWDRVAGIRNAAGYVYRTALNLHRSRLRRLAVSFRRRPRPEPVDPIAASDDRATLRRALASLPAGQREALVLVEWLGMTDVEAGSVLGIEPVSVRSRISRARQGLRPLLRSDDRGDDDA